jgi:outer membrane autotransporter protein
MTSDGNAQNLETFRSGFSIGIDKRLNNALLAGLLLATGDAKLTQRHNGNRIDLDDFVFGLYMQYQFLSELQLNSYIGLGLQKFKSKRQNLIGFDANQSPIYDFAKSEYDGNSAFWNVELIRPIHWRPGIAFMPGIAVDLRYAHADAFTESGYFNTHIGSSNVDQVFFRAGFNSLWKINDRFRLETQSWYSRQIGGNDTLSMNMAIPVPGVIKPANLKGIKAGRDSVALGVGSRYYLSEKKQTQLILDYVFERGNRTKAHVVNLGFNYNF